MSNFISVTGISQKSQSSNDWKALTGTLAFDVSDICDVILRDAGNTYSYFDINPIKDDSKSTGSKQQYRVSDSLTNIANQSTGLVRLSVISRRSKTVSYTAVFVASKMSQRLEVVSGGSSTRFWYNEDGDALPVEYIVSNTIAQIIAQTNSSFSFLVRNGLTLNSGYIELGGSLIQNTDIDLDEFNLDQSSAYFGYTTLYRKAYNLESLSIDNGATDSISELKGFGGGISAGFGFSKQVIDSALVVNMIESFEALTGYTLATNTGFTTDILFRVNPNNANGAGIIETPPTYAYTPAEDPADALVAINAAGELYNTGILPSSLGGGPRPLFQQLATAGNVSTGLQVLYTNTIPGNTFVNDGDRITAKYIVKTTGSADTKRFLLYLGLNFIFNSDDEGVDISTEDHTFELTVTIMQVSAGTLKTSCSLFGSKVSTAEFLSDSQYVAAGGLDLTLPFDLELQGEVGGAGTNNEITAMFAHAEFMPGA